MLMNRPIDFRIWHTQTGRMLAVFFFTDCWIWTDTGESFRSDECALMQFSGRVDQVGAKLWEGDIVRWDCPQTVTDIASGEVEYSAYYYVIFHNGGFALLPVGYDDPFGWDVSYFTDFHDTLPYVRVGTIHEHPELLQLTQMQPLHPDCIQK